MRALTDAYHRAVLWLLSRAARRAVETIYARGHEDGVNELRAWMRRELMEVQVAQAADRARSYQQGFREALRLVDDEPQGAIIERVH
jgi:hypothetical protein